MTKEHLKECIRISEGDLRRLGIAMECSMHHAMKELTKHDLLPYFFSQRNYKPENTPNELKSEYQDWVFNEVSAINLGNEREMK